MNRSARNAPETARLVLVAACAASAGAHAALVPAHLEHGTALGVAFVLAALLMVGLAAALATAPSNRTTVESAALALVALIAAYALSVTTGLPGLIDEPERIDAAGLVTKAVEAVGLVFALHMKSTLGGRGSLFRKEARS